MSDRKILDSGERVEFETGAVRDIKEGKGRMDLIPIDMFARILEEDFSKDEIRPIRNIELFLDSKNTDYLLKAVMFFTDLINEDTPLFILSKHYEEGAKKYSAWNWTKGIPTHSFLDSSLRHYVKWLYGWEDEPHDAAFLWNIVGLCWTIKNRPDLDDIKYTQDILNSENEKEPLNEDYEDGYCYLCSKNAVKVNKTSGMYTIGCTNCNTHTEMFRSEDEAWRSWREITFDSVIDELAKAAEEFYNKQAR